MNELPKLKYVNFKPWKGGVRAYLRHKSLPKPIALASPIPAPGEEEGSAMEIEVASYLSGLEPPAPKGVLSRALSDYEASHNYQLKLRDSTKANLYGPILMELRDEYGDAPLAGFTPAYVLRMMDRWANQRGYQAANHRKQVLKNALKRPRINGEIVGDPFALIENVARPDGLSEPHVMWPEEVVRTVIDAALEQRLYGVARAVAIGRYAGFRCIDLVRMTERFRSEGRWQFTTGKKNVEVDQPVDRRLAQLLEAIPDAQPDEARQGRKLAAGVKSMPPTTLVFNVANRAYKRRALGVAVQSLVKRLHKAGKIDRDVYDVHGLRHTRGVELALSGCTEEEGARMLGHANPSSFRVYTRQADRRRQSDAAAAKVEAYVSLEEVRKEKAAAAATVS